MIPDDEYEAEHPEGFIIALIREDELGAVIRAQVYLEHELLGFVHKRVAAPAALTRADLSFARLVRFALALGLPSEFAKPLHAFARVRNEFAHRLDTQLTKARVDQFCQSFSEAMRKEADERIELFWFVGRGPDQSAKSLLTPRGIFNFYSWYLIMPSPSHTTSTRLH
jgi:hypothetical protein